MRIYDRPTVVDRVRQLLDTAREPLTSRAVAARANTSAAQAARALRRLEDQGAAVRQVVAGGRYAWTTPSDSTSTSR